MRPSKKKSLPLPYKADDLAVVEQSRDEAKLALKNVWDMVRERDSKIATWMKKAESLQGQLAQAFADQEAAVADIKHKDESYAALSKECEEHRRLAKVYEKDRDRIRAKLDNLESALDASRAENEKLKAENDALATRTKSLERSCRELLSAMEEGSEAEKLTRHLPKEALRGPPPGGPS